VEVEVEWEQLIEVVMVVGQERGGLMVVETALTIKEVEDEEDLTEC
jgi:hypothetical protein